MVNHFNFQATNEENLTSSKEFIMLPFFIKSNYMTLYLPIFFYLFVFGAFINAVIIILVYISNHLHTPMYLFLCNLSAVDICYTTVTVPKLLYICISRNNTISFSECFTQMYFYLLAGITEDIIIIIMSFDRYVAICNPLHYHSILNKKNCFFLMIGCWILGSCNSILITFEASRLIFCHSMTIHQFFCDVKALINIACGGLKHFNAIIYIELFIFGFFPLMCSLVSYRKIMKVILKINSTEGRRKAFSTCSSHLAVVFMYYTSASCAYMMPKYFNVPQQMFSVVYIVVTPVLNPLIYSLRNNDVKRAFKRLFGIRGKYKQ